MPISEREMRLLDAYNQKLESLTKALQLTKGTKLDGGEQDAERYVDLFEARKDFFDEASKLDGVIQSADNQALLENGSAELRKEAELVRNKTTGVAKELLAMDQLMAKEAPNMIANLKKGLKGLNEGRNVNNAYQVDAGYGNGSTFDASK